MGERFEADFRKAMRRLASAVTVISTTHEDRRHGMTATAVTSVSSNPPSLLACINRSASLHAPLIASGHFCVNILHGSQSDIADAFGGCASGDERFAAGAGRCMTTACPISRDAQASIFCASDLVTSYGTHCDRDRKDFGSHRRRPCRAAALSGRALHRRSRRRDRLGGADLIHSPTRAERPTGG